jgi:hypothetical protein
MSTRPKEEPSLQLLGFRLNVVGHYQPATIYLLIDAGLGRHFRPEAPGSPHREAMDPSAREPCVLVHSPFRRA